VRQWSYTWDAEDRLVRAETPDGTLWRYAYDALGRRVAKTRLDVDGEPAEQLIFSWDGSDLAEQSGRGADGIWTALTWDFELDTFAVAAQTRRTWVDGASVAEVDRAFHAIVTDSVGTPTELVDADGRIAWRRESTLWGAPIGATVDGSRTAATDVVFPLRFPGQYHDPETGMEYSYFRYYDSGTGTFASPDPLGLAPAPNPYTYVRNPLILADPLGLMGAQKRKIFDHPSGWSLRLDRFPMAGQNDFEIHVWKGKTEIGAFGSNGWFHKHRLGTDITVPQNIENHLKGIAIDTMRQQERLGPKGVDDVTGDNWKRPRIAPGNYA
jgi:RHS repeat-associated protein